MVIAQWQLIQQHPESTPILADPLAKQELLAGLSEMGGGVIGGTTAPQSVTIGDVTADVSIEQSEDFENEGYDVVIITLTDPKTGAVIQHDSNRSYGSNNK